MLTPAPSPGRHHASGAISRKRGEAKTMQAIESDNHENVHRTDLLIVVVVLATAAVVWAVVL